VRRSSYSISGRLAEAPGALLVSCYGWRNAGGWNFFFMKT